MDFENKTSLTIEEFKAFMSGLIQGKNGALPDQEDWKIINTMLGKVQPSSPTYIPYTPYNWWWNQPYKPWWLTNTATVPFYSGTSTAGGLGDATCTGYVPNGSPSFLAEGRAAPTAAVSQTPTPFVTGLATVSSINEGKK